MSKVFNSLDMFAEPELELDSIIFKVFDSDSIMLFDSDYLNDEDFSLTPDTLEFSLYLKKGIFELIEYFGTLNTIFFDKYHSADSAPIRFFIHLTNGLTSRCDIIFEGSYSGYELTGNIVTLKFKGTHVSHSFDSRREVKYFNLIEE